MDYLTATLHAAWTREEGAGEKRAPRWTLRGRVLVPGTDHLYLFATAPADRMATFSGSGLPAPHEQFPPTQGPIRVPVGVDGAFSVTIAEPNAYYDADGVLRGPEACLRVGGATHRVALPASARIPFRSLSYLAGPPAGTLHDDVLSQEALLRARAYPRECPV